MKKCFVKTSNTARYMSAITALEDRGADEACLVVVDGEPGLGKTETVQWWVTQTAAVYLRAKQEWTPAWVLRELLAALDEKMPAGSFERMYGQALLRLSERVRLAAREDQAFAVVIDEVDYISKRETIVNTFRDLSDMTEIPFVLVGMGRVRHHLARFPQVASRVGQYVAFEKASIDDVRGLVDGLCEVPVADDLVKLLHRESQGLVREIKEGIGSIERRARTLGATAPISIADMEGQVLLNDRSSGKPIRVRA
ncbi:AAA family ATPase [Inquilinus sp. CA228]|uniref:AAA family ATPase n=1 Tax=Inquilinus sp. CA228 TaxID=3455609 RepID=UPI003F8D7DE6